MQKSCRKGELLLHAARELAHKTLSEGPEPCALENCFRALHCGILVSAVKRAEKHDILIYCHICVEAEKLRHISGMNPGRAPVGG